MHEKSYRFVIFALLFISIVLLFGLGFQTSRLEQTRYELESVRMELSAATNRQSELAEVLRRDSEILSESFDTISGIRSQIAAIRESYEKMENIIANGNCSSNK